MQDILRYLSKMAELIKDTIKGSAANMEIGKEIIDTAEAALQKLTALQAGQ